MNPRPPAVAGLFYPANPAALSTVVDCLLDGVSSVALDGAASGYVVPHAGYRFSGPVAAQVYARIRHHAPTIRRVVLAGPSHYVHVEEPAVPTVDNWLTPLGEASIDVTLRDVLLGTGCVVADDAPHQREHSLEVQLPFLLRTLGDVPVLPIAMGRSPVDKAVEILETVMTAAGPEALLLCSTDLSHYHDHVTAQRLDRRTADAILRLRPEQIGAHDACGADALRGTVGWAQRRGLTAELLDLRTSADTQGNPDRVVGYPAFAFIRRHRPVTT